MENWLTEDQRKLKLFCREFAHKEIEATAKETDDKELFPMENIKKLSEQGLCGIYVPKELGGMGLDMLSYVTAVEEISKVCATTGVIFSGQQSLFCSPILAHATEEQKKKYIPKLAKGEWIGAFALTEPGAGTDIQSLQTKAVEDGDNFVLNGSKIFITNAGYANLFITFAITGTHVNKRGKKVKDCTAFLVERTDPGFSVTKPEQKMGIKGSSTCVLNFDNCVIPKDRVLGNFGEGFHIALGTLDGGRIGISAQALGIAGGALEETVKYLKAHAPKGRITALPQAVQFKLADLYAEVQSAKGVVYTAAKKKDQGLNYSVEAATAKLYAAKVATDVATAAVELCGYDGLSMDLPIERMMRDAKITEIYEGTSEVQRMVIAGYLDSMQF